jgi:hypothetical protein
VGLTRLEPMPDDRADPADEIETRVRDLRRRLEVEAG